MNIMLRVVGMAYSQNVTGDMILQHLVDDPAGFDGAFTVPGPMSDTPLFVASQMVIAQLQFAADSGLEKDNGRIC